MFSYWTSQLNEPPRFNSISKFFSSELWILVENLLHFSFRISSIEWTWNHFSQVHWLFVRLPIVYSLINKSKLVWFLLFIQLMKKNLSVIVLKVYFLLLLEFDLQSKSEKMNSVHVDAPSSDNIIILQQSLFISKSHTVGF